MNLKGFKTKTLKIPGISTAIILTGLIFALGFTPPAEAIPGIDANKEYPQAVQTSPTTTADNDPSTEIPYDDYYSSFFAYPWDIPEEAAGVNSFWIEVDLSNQILYAYRGDRIINAFWISSGAGATPTETGTFKIYAKYDQYNMTGPEYEYPNVPYTMFFYKGYSIHGTYWHNNFGTPMSWGCVNMKTDEAAWIYENAPVGTYVFIHY